MGAFAGKQTEGFHFRRQQVVDGFIVDFYCHLVGLVVEVDGSSHDDRMLYDRQRSEVLDSKGLHVIRFTNLQVLFEIDKVCGAILSELQQLLIAESAYTPSP
jgi:very-short-patch-repair endonuclease